MATTAKSLQGVNPEARSERVSLAVTPTEKKAVRVLAVLYETDESNLLRTSSLADLMQEYHRLEAARGAA